MWQQHLNNYWQAVSHPTELCLVAMVLLALTAILTQSGARSFVLVIIAVVITEYLPVHGAEVPAEWVQLTRACLVALTAGFLLRFILRRSTSMPFEIPLLVFALGWLSFSIYLEKTYQAQASTETPSAARVRTLGQFTSDLLKQAFQSKTIISSP